MTNNKSKEEITENSKKPKKIWKIILIIFGVLVGILGIMGVVGYFKIQQWLEPKAGRTNVVILGMGGEDHEGGDLTDSMLFASIDHQTGNVVTVSLPRDIWVDDLKTKLNSVYHYQQQEGVKRELGAILGQNINYYVLLDFQSVVKIVDALGGVVVEVQNTFDDYLYPIAGKEEDLCDGDSEYKCRYEHIHFEAGMTVMDGTTALKYIRSRHAEGDEGTDFAREARQRQLISALKAKAFSTYWLTHPEKTKEIFNLITANIQTDYPQSEYEELFKVFWQAWRGKAQFTSLPMEEYLETPKDRRKYDNQWVLVFKKERLEEFQGKLKELLN